ncbi:hypothetical protein SDC9_159251 [bioreactor metagenome]|uniref:STAS domain-containing protein n=2 Tax=root TaxID=1 RepID=A0A645FEN7_9ZZZZ
MKHQDEVIIDISTMTLWDSTAVEVIDKLINKNKNNGIKTTFIGANKQSEELLKKVSKNIA